MRVYADGGDLSVLRTVAAFAYGKYDITYPEHYTPPRELRFDREWGYVAKLAKGDVPPASRRFVRRDVKVDAPNRVSDVEKVLDSAAETSSGEVILSREINHTGLGRLVPYQDFGIGSVLNVVIFGETIPLVVSKITGKLTESGKTIWSVNMGGQLLQDIHALNSSTAEVEAQIQAERRERLKGDKSTSDKVTAVNTTATSAAATATSAVQKATVVEVKTEKALEEWRREKDRIDNELQELVAENRRLVQQQQQLVRKISELTVAILEVPQDKMIYSELHRIGIWSPNRERNWLYVVASPDFTGHMIVDLFYSGGSVISYTINRNEFTHVSNWQNWEYYGGYNGNYFNPLRGDNGDLLVYAWNAQLGEVVKVRVYTTNFSRTIGAQ